MRLERLTPPTGPVAPGELLATVAPGDRAPRERPFVLANMVTTVDGRAAVDGRSGPIGGPADEAVFHELRTIVDAVLVGTGTLRAERYGRLVRDPERRERRRAAGLAADPLAVLLSRRLDPPWDVPLFADPAQRVVVACEATAIAAAGGAVVAVPADVAADVTLLALEAPTVPAVLAALRAEHGVRSVLCEGGPRLLAEVLRAGALDELFVTVGALLAGGTDALGMLSGPALEPPVALELLWALRHDQEVLLRYGVT